MIRSLKKGLSVLQFELLLEFPALKHGIFLRQGGFSHGYFNSLNTSYFVGDLEENVTKNLNKINEMLLENLPRVQQHFFGIGEHKTTIQLIDSQSEQVIPNCDGLITTNKNSVLLMRHADCQIALFYDPIRQVIANIHSGWRGSKQNIYALAVKKMEEHFQSKPENIFVCISPSLGPKNFEFLTYQEELPKEFWQFQVKPSYFDFWAISQFQLESLGILPHHIQIARVDTYENSEDFFSFRRDRITGRHLTYIALSF